MSTNPKPEEWACIECNGTGMAEPDCCECGGNGWVDDPDDGGTMTCPTCGDDKCDTCKGTGERPSPSPNKQDVTQ